MKPPAGETDYAHSFIRSRPSSVRQVEQDVPSRLSTGNHSHRRRPPLGANTSGHQGNRAIETLVHAVANYFDAPGSGTEDLIERLRMRSAGGWPLLNQHVQLSPHHVTNSSTRPAFIRSPTRAAGILNPYGSTKRNAGAIRFDDLSMFARRAHDRFLSSGSLDRFPVYRLGCARLATEKGVDAASPAVC
jgi:hypothetical protein